MEGLRLAVRSLVERVLLSGNIDNRIVDSSDMLAGARAHRKIQRTMGEEYRGEVSLKLDTFIDDIPVSLYGRADGVITLPGGEITVDEIKTTAMPLDRVQTQSETHMAQAKCYAYMLLCGMDAPPAEITVQLTYYQMDTGDIERRATVFTREELKAFFDGLLAKYAVFLRFERDWTALRDETARALGFPYASYRGGQRAFAVAAYSAIDKGKRLYAQAPTGTGKTISALFPAVKAIGEGKAKKIFYLTAKTVARAVAEEALWRMAEKGLRIKSITLRAKEKLCPLEEPDCNPESCARARGHYDRVNDALLSLISAHDIITADIIEAHASAHNVCPHEFMLDVSEWADIVICDYNHVFDPVACLRRFFSEPDEGYVFLIDEAHNLNGRVREMYTATLDNAAFDKLRRGFTSRKKAVASLKKTMLSVSRGLKDACGEEPELAQAALDTEIVSRVAAFTQAAAEFLAKERHHPLYRELRTLYFDALFYVSIAEGYGAHYASLTEKTDRRAAVTLYCLDPSGFIRARLALAGAAVLFSATLTPLTYYRDTLGGTEEDGILALQSAFDEKKLLLIAHAGISTKYPDRAQSRVPIAEAIHAAIAQKKGNYIAYFPSYVYMRDVLLDFTAAYPDIRTLTQEADMGEAARAAFLAAFAAENTQTLVGFCVLGGAFSEGVDLAGERLIGAIIVGVGLPKLSLRQNLIRGYYDVKNGAGYDYAYVFPGMNKVMQAAGRVIRTEDDYGLALLIDSRFNTAKYRALFPAHWAHITTIWNSEGLSEALRGFPYFQ